MDKPKSSPFSIQPHILILFLLLGIPPLVVGHILLVNRAEDRFREVVGRYFGHEAGGLQLNLVSYIEKLQARVGNLTALEEVQAVVREAYNRQPDEKGFADEIKQIEQAWPAMNRSNSKLLDQILSNPASRFLNDFNRTSATFRELLVADRFGRLVAASGKTTDYFQADETWWRVAFLEGTGQQYVSDVQYDDSAGVYSIQLAEPIRDESTGTVLGIIKGVVDSHEMFGMLDNLKFGSDATAILLRPNGTMATSPGSDDIYPYTSEVNSAIERGRRWLEVPEVNPRFFVGLPEFTIKSKLPTLDWVVAVESPYADVFAPFRNLRSWFVYFAVLSIALVILLAVIFTWILSRPIIETDPHLEQV